MTNETPTDTPRTQRISRPFCSEARSLVSLAVPLIAGSASFTLFGLINSIFLGPLGEVPLAAVSLTLSVSIILYGALFGLIGPVGYLIGTAFGASGDHKIAEVVRHGAVLGFGAGLIGFLLHDARALRPALLRATGGDYQYDVLFGSWTGYTSTTTLEVRGDEVVMCSYKTRDAEGEVTKSWTEEGNALGSHESGAPLRTIEELYAVCRNEVLTQDRNENDIFLEFGDDGVLEYCEYFPKNCADDCLMGVSVDDIRFLNKDAAEAFALTTNQSAYVATCTDDSFPNCTFTVKATYHNRTDAPVYLHRCYLDSEYPIFGMPALDKTVESAYDPAWGCVGHDDPIKVDPGETRTDLLEVSGPNASDGVTGEPFGVLEGAFGLSYAAYPCAEEGGCERLPDTQHLSVPFKVTIVGSAIGDEGP